MDFARLGALLLAHDTNYRRGSTSAKVDTRRRHSCGSWLSQGIIVPHSFGCMVVPRTNASAACTVGLGSRFLGAARLAVLTLQEWDVVVSVRSRFGHKRIDSSVAVAVLWLSIFGFERHGRACHERFGVFLCAVMFYSF